MSATQAATQAATWDDLVSAALLGTARRSTEAAGLPGPLAAAASRLPPSGDAAARLLDVAALATVYRRAGTRIRPARPRPQPVPADDGRLAGPPAQHRLARLLSTNDAELLSLWLRTATARGLRPQPALLPALLDAAVRAPRLRADVAAATGARGRWLAAHRPQWADALPRPPAPDAWRLGSPPERRAWLRDLRRTDPAAARETLADGWEREPPAERAGLLEVLGAGLSAADEPFLERCLADRRAEVRELAGRLLTAVPESAYARRAAAGALAAVRRQDRLGRSRLAVADLPRDRLLPLVAAAPLAAWVPALGRTPADVLALAGADEPGPTLWRAWAAAATRERDAEWVAALVLWRGHPAPVTAGMVTLLEALPGPWPPAVADAVLRRLPGLPAVTDPGARRLLPLLGRRLPVDAVGALRSVAQDWPPQPWPRQQVLTAIDVMTFRREMLQELE